MKTTFFFLFVLSASAAFGQARTTEPVIYSAPSHTAHADYASVSWGQSVLSSASYATAQGERRASDFPQPNEVSLGMAARELKKQHDQMKKSPVVFIN